MKQFLICLYIIFSSLAHAQAHVFGIGTNLTFSSSVNTGSVTPYLFYRNDQHQFGLGPMLGKRINANIYNSTNIGYSSFIMQLENGNGITGLQIHYRFFPYPQNRIFDIFFEAQIASTHINIMKNGESYKNGVFFNTMGGLGFQMKFAKRFALTQTTLAGVKNVYMPNLNDVQGFSKSFLFTPRISLGTTLSIEIKLFK